MEPSVDRSPAAKRDYSDESASHLDAIEALAQELSRPIAEVKQAYESEFARLQLSARVTDYLILFATRRAKESLTRRLA